MPCDVGISPGAVNSTVDAASTPLRVDVSSRARIWWPQRFFAGTIAVSMSIVNVGYRSTNFWVVSAGRSRLLVDLGWPGLLGALEAELRRVSGTSGVRERAA